MTTSNATPVVHLSWIKEFALKILGIAESFWAQFEPVLKTDAQALAAIAVPIVTGLLVSELSGTAKQADASKQLQAAATAAGIQAGTQAINLAIEMAYASVKPASPVSAPVLPNGGAATTAPAVN